MNVRPPFGPHAVGGPRKPYFRHMLYLVYLQNKSVLDRSLDYPMKYGIGAANFRNSTRTFKETKETNCGSVIF